MLSWNLWIFHLHITKKQSSSRPKFYKAFKKNCISNWVSIARVAALLPKASLSLPAATAANSKTPCVCTCHSNLARWSTGEGSSSDSNNFCSLKTGLYAPKPQNKLCGVWILFKFRSVEDAKIETSAEFSSSSHRPHVYFILRSETICIHIITFASEKNSVRLSGGVSLDFLQILPLLISTFRFSPLKS